MSPIHAIGRSKGGASDTCPLGVQIHSISCSFRQKIYKNNPNLGVGAPPRENPGSVTACISDLSDFLNLLKSPNSMKILLHLGKTSMFAQTSNMIQGNLHNYDLKVHLSSDTLSTSLIRRHQLYFITRHINLNFPSTKSRKSLVNKGKDALIHNI